MLEMLGVSQGAEAVYRAMLGQPDHGVEELATDTGLTSDQVRTSLNELADLALLRPSAHQGALRPVSPQVGLAALLAAAEAETAIRQAQLEATRAAIASIAAEHEVGRDGNTGQRLEGLDQVRIRLEELQQLTQTECLSLNPGGAHLPDARDAAKPLNQQALERGVVIRAVCRESFRNDADTLAYARWMTNLGGQMRTVPAVPMPLVIVDRKVAILPLDPTDARVGALEVHSPGVLAAVCALFEQIWTAGTPFGQSAPIDAHGCTPMERKLLEIISDGHTDEVAARNLGISLRTVRRMMADLMVRLDAVSRFQAGVNATRHGWL
ncbi:helix-turn-helix transcriptional regulator [Streptomyces tateyamensis]|uniref:Helix-turn-helix transcriptional regulator n=1 Tax=Streptomyces tateyamensis TaxID=565073 RepID=A0A2V4NE39_9ACTN|nr:helix-turn-helix transcriptional regulator [Streptomyces tateyamensis]PYC77445.1 helix-turn-helix transcriptional regulator [Streptomyces tateyamensis]